MQKKMLWIQKPWCRDTFRAGFDRHLILFSRGHFRDRSSPSYFFFLSAAKHTRGCSCCCLVCSKVARFYRPTSQVTIYFFEHTSLNTPLEILLNDLWTKRFRAFSQIMTGTNAADQWGSLSCSFYLSSGPSSSFMRFPSISSPPSSSPPLSQSDHTLMYANYSWLRERDCCRRRQK